MSITPHAGHDAQINPEHGLQGTTVDAHDAVMLRKAVELAFNYRGDVTLTLRDGRIIEGYIFDLKTEGAAGGAMSVRMMPAGRDDKVAVPLTDIERLAFTGRDTASGKSFETWVRKYVEKKMAGERASIESETLE